VWSVTAARTQVTSTEPAAADNVLSATHIQGPLLNQGSPHKHLCSMPCHHTGPPSCPPVRLWLTGPACSMTQVHRCTPGPPAAALVRPLPLAPPARGAASSSSSPCSSSWLLLEAGAGLQMRLAQQGPGGPPAAPACPLCSTLDGRPGSSSQSKLWSGPPGRSASAAAYRLRFFTAVERPPGSHQHRVGWGDTTNVRVAHKSCGACFCKDANNEHRCSGSNNLQ
jgi:hypothetical protein